MTEADPTDRWVSKSLIYSYLVAGVGFEPTTFRVVSVSYKINDLPAIGSR